MFGRSDAWKARNFKVDHECMVIFLADRIEVCKLKGFLDLSLYANPPAQYWDNYYDHVDRGEEHIRLAALNTYRHNSFMNQSILEGMVSACLDDTNLGCVFTLLHLGDLVEDWSPSVVDFYRGRCICAMIGELLAVVRDADNSSKAIRLGLQATGTAISSEEIKKYTEDTINQFVGLVIHNGFDNIAQYKRRLNIGVMDDSRNLPSRKEALKAFGMREFDLLKQYPSGFTAGEKVQGRLDGTRTEEQVNEDEAEAAQVVKAAEQLFVRLSAIGKDARNNAHPYDFEDVESNGLTEDDFANVDAKVEDWDITRHVSTDERLKSLKSEDIYENEKKFGFSNSINNETRHSLRQGLADFVQPTGMIKRLTEEREAAHLADPSVVKCLMTGSLASLHQSLHSICHSVKPADFYSDSEKQSDSEPPVAMVAAFKVCLPSMPKHRQLVIFRLLYNLTRPNLKVIEKENPDPITQLFYGFQPFQDNRGYYANAFAKMTNRKRPPRPPRKQAEIEFERRAVRHTRLLSDSHAQLARFVASAIISSGASNFAYESAEARKELLSAYALPPHQRGALSKIFTVEIVEGISADTSIALHTLHQIVYPMSPGLDLTGLPDLPGPERAAGIALDAYGGQASMKFEPFGASHVSTASRKRHAVGDFISPGHIQRQWEHALEVLTRSAVSNSEWF